VVVMKNGIIGKKTSPDRGIALLLASTIFPVVGIVMAVLLGSVLGTLDTSKAAFIIGVLFFIIILTLRQYELTATAVIGVRLYADWYLGLGVVAQIMTMILLAIFFIFRTPRRSLIFPKALWIWVLFLLIAIIPATRGISLQDAVYYYSNVIFSAFIVFWLGIILAHDIAHVRRLLRLLSYYATFMAIITIIQAVTGKLLFGTTNYDGYLASIGNYALFRGTAIFRTGGFFVSPDGSGGFFAMMFMIPLGLFFESSTWLEKALYLIETCLILSALASSYSTESWLSLCTGVVVFLVLVGRVYYQFLLLLIITAIIIVIITVFPSQIALQLRHAGDPNELLLRSGAWQTGIQVIHAFPFSGLGLGRHVYVKLADPYRVITQYRPLDHPHDSFLELAALGGLPVALLFTVLLLFTFWLALRNWFRSDAKLRPLFAGGIASAIALTIFSLSDAGWTVAPLLATGWLILGVVSTSLGASNRDRETLKVKEEAKQVGRSLL